MTLYDDHFARWSYEQLLLQQPHIPFEGLWRNDAQHFIVCKSVADATTIDGEDLRLWFDHKCRVVTSRVDIVESCPTDAIQVPERTSAERARLAGAPRTGRDLSVDLGLELPKDFPPFTVKTLGGDVFVITARPLSEYESKLAQDAWSSLGYAKSIKFSVDPEIDPLNEPFRYGFGSGDINLIPSRRLGGKYSKELRSLVEEDEQAWTRNKERLFEFNEGGQREILSAPFVDSSILSCLVDASVFVPDNIRNHLSLYDRVYLNLPLSDTFSENCAALGVTEIELRKLVELGRVHLILPQPIDRYPVGILNSIAESAPQNIILSRRLSLATVIDARRRVPILYPPLSPIERHVILHALANNSSNLVGPASAPKLLRFLSELGSNWSSSEWSLNTRGAMGTSHLGIGAISSAVYEQITGKDLRLELWSAAQKVEWAAALGAHVFPSSAGGYDESKACDLVAGVYGQWKSNRIIPHKRVVTAVEDLLAVNSSVNVVDFAKEFASSDIQRLRTLILRLTQENTDNESLGEALRAFNADVRHYEKRPDLLKSLNVVGLLSAGLAAGKAFDPSIARLIPLAGSLLGFMLNRLFDEIPRYSANGGKVIDYCNSILTLKSNPNAVLVARARKDISRFRK